MSHNGGYPAEQGQWLLRLCREESRGLCLCHCLSLVLDRTHSKSEGAPRTLQLLPPQTIIRLLGVSSLSLPAKAPKSDLL